MLSADRCIRLQAGAALFSEGDVGSAAYLIKSGVIEIFVPRSGGAIVIGRRGPGEIIGEMALLSEGLRSASARVVAECELVPVTARQIAHHFADIDPIARMCLCALVERLRETIPPEEAGGFSNRSDLLAPMPQSDFDLAVSTLTMERQIEHALLRGEFELHLQPIVHIASGALRGFEALIRWHHPTRGLVLPGSFIQIAEASGLITRITEWCIGEACCIYPALLDAENAAAGPRASRSVGRPLFVSVNISGRDLARPDFADVALAILEQAGVPPDGLMLEVTEGMLLKDQSAARHVLEACRQRGIHVALDDFGTGYSSLSHLTALPITEMKIDRSFISSIASDPGSLKVAVTIQRLANDLDLTVVAEGIERSDQADVLIGMGCEYGQGYFYGRPMPVAAALAAVREWPSAPGTPVPAGVRQGRGPEPLRYQGPRALPDAAALMDRS